MPEEDEGKSTGEPGATVSGIRSRRKGTDQGNVAESGSSGGGEAPKRRRRSPNRKPRKSQEEIEEEIFPSDFAMELSSMSLDLATTAAGTTPRTNDEKQSFAALGRRVVLKRAPEMEHFEEVAFGLFAVALGLSIFYEMVQNRKTVERAERQRQQDEVRIQ